MQKQQLLLLFIIIIIDRITEGMREAKLIHDSPDLVIAVPLLLIYAHKQCKTIDKEAIHELEASVKSNRRSCSDAVSTAHSFN